MSVLKVPKRRCAMCNVEIEYSEYLEEYKEELNSQRTTPDELDRIWDDLAILIYCGDCIQYSRLDVDLCEPDKL